MVYSLKAGGSTSSYVFYLWILQFSPNHWADPLRRLARDSSRRQPRTNSSSFNSPAKILCWTLSILNNDIGLLRSCLKHPTIRVRRIFQLRVGLGSSICIKYQVNWVLSGIEILIGYSPSISLNISYTFNIYHLIWLIWSIKHVFGRHIYVTVVQCGRSWQPFGDHRKSHKPLESAHLSVWHWTLMR